MTDTDCDTWAHSLFALQRDTLFDIFLHFCSSQKMGNGGLWLPTLLNFIRAEDFAVEI